MQNLWIKAFLTDFFNPLLIYKTNQRDKLFIMQEAFWSWKYIGYTHSFLQDETLEQAVCLWCLCRGVGRWERVGREGGMAGEEEKMHK